ASAPRPGGRGWPRGCPRGRPFGLRRRTGAQSREARSRGVRGGAGRASSGTRGGRACAHRGGRSRIRSSDTTLLSTVQHTITIYRDYSFVKQVCSRPMRARRTITVVGCHAGGEVGNVVTGGVLPPAGATVFEQMQTLARVGDGLRRLLLREPRGSVACHANLVVPSTRPDCDAGFIIMEPTEYPPMSGSNAICTATVLLETGMVEMQEPETTLRLEAPGGVVEARAACRDGRCESVEITNVASFADRLDAPLEVAGLGTLTVDIAYGGMWYAIADAAALGFAIEPGEARDLSLAGERIRAAAREQLPCAHPENPDTAGVSIVQIAGPWQGLGAVSRNAVVVAPGRLDRSATGTGLSARMAV